MRAFLKLLIFFFIVFMMAYPLFYAVDTSYDAITNEACTAYDNDNVTENVTNHLISYRSVFRTVYSIYGIGLVLAMVAYGVIKYKESKYEL